MRPHIPRIGGLWLLLVALGLHAQQSLVRLDEPTLTKLRAHQTERVKLLEPALSKITLQGLAGGHSFKLRTTEVDMYGRTLARYDHFFHGIRVEGSEAIGLLRADGTTERMDYPFNSLLEPDALQASVSKEHALDLARKKLNTSNGEPCDAHAELVLTPIIERQFQAFPTANPGGPRGADPSESALILKGWRLVHVVQQYLSKRAQAFTTSIDAQTGEVISHGENASEDIRGIAQFNRYNSSATVPLPGTQYGSVYYLQRGGLFSVNVGDVLNPVYSSYSSTFGDGNEYTSGQWSSVNGQTQAVDVFYGISSTYDFYLTLFGRHSIDGSDGYFIPIAAHHPNTNGAPARFWWSRNFWGQESYWIDFTDRFDPSVPGGPTELSVTAHEWTHGVNRRCSRVGTDDRDAPEAKAINEATSTIMSTAVRFWDSTGRYGGIGYPDPYRWTFDWVYEPQVKGGYPGKPDPVGVEFLYRPSHPHVRGRQEPSWWTASKVGWTSDVHGMGAPLHRLFYFLVNGSPALTSLTEDSRDRTSPFMPLGFQGLGAHNATVLYYQALTQTFTTWMDLVGAGQAVQQAANQIFGTGSVNSWITASALAAVNLAPPPAYAFPISQPHASSATALPLPSLEHAGSALEPFATGSGSVYYQVTIPAGVSLTAAASARIRDSVSDQGPSVQILDASGSTVLTGTAPLAFAPTQTSGSHGEVINQLWTDPPEDPYVPVGGTVTWKNSSTSPVTVLVKVFSSQPRTVTYTCRTSVRLDIREITGNDSLATQW